MPLTLIGHFLFSAIMQMTIEVNHLCVVLKMSSNETPFANNRYM